MANTTTAFQTITPAFRTKTEAKEAIKRGEILFVVRGGETYPKMRGGPVTVACKLDHYKEWTGEAECWHDEDGRITRLR